MACDTNRAGEKLGLKLNGSVVLLATPHRSAAKRRITYPRYSPCASCCVAHYARACISSSGTYYVTGPSVTSITFKMPSQTTVFAFFASGSGIGLPAWDFTATARTTNNRVVSYRQTDPSAVQVAANQHVTQGACSCVVLA